MHFAFILSDLVVLALICVPAQARFDFLQRFDKRLVCVQDDLYDGFHNANPEDINPWCSSYLGIPEYTATRAGGTSRVTVITTTTTVSPYFQTTKVPTYLTTTTTTLDAPQKRNAAPDPTPAAALDQLYSAAPIIQLCDESEANKSVIASVSSACSCLFIAPRTVDVSMTTTVTRTESAVDFQSTPIYITQPSNATLTETVTPTRAPYNTTLPGTGGTLPTFISISFSPSTSGGPAPSQNSSTSSPTASGTTSSGTPSSASPAPLTTRTCVVQDGLIVTQRDGEQFQGLCFTNFTGPTDVGLDMPTYRSCLQQCALINDGFSNIRCYGISYFPSRQGPNCYLKDMDEVATPDYNPNYQVVSGILLRNSTKKSSSAVLAPSTSIPTLNSTLNVGPTGPTGATPVGPPYNTTSLGPTAPVSYPYNFTLETPGTSPGPTAPVSAGNSTTPSLVPSPSANSSFPASITPSPSLNISITPSAAPTTDYNYTAPDMSESDNPRSRHPGSSSGSSGFPIPSANVTSGYPIPSFNVTPSGFPAPTGNITSGFPTPPSNVTTSGSPIPTSNGTSGFPAPPANLTSSGFPTPPTNGTSGFPAPTSNGTSGFPTPNSNGTSSGFPVPSGNASTCFFTDWITATATETICESYVTIFTSAPPRSIASTKTITQTYTIAINAAQ